MPLALIPSYIFYCSLSGVTPGPANITSLNAAMRYGKQRALVQWRGITVGFAFDALLSAFVVYFLGESMGRYVDYLSFVGAAYILWLALHILRSTGKERASDAKDCSFRNGFIVQATNAKVILLCLTALSSYVLPYHKDLGTLLLVGLTLPLLGGPTWNLLWLYAGAALQDFFHAHEKPLNILMALALLLCAVSLVWPFFRA